MNIKETFLALTSRTYPYGFEEDLISFLPKGYQTDDDGNYFYKIGESKTIFASHLDTACKDQVDVVHEFDGKMIRTNGKSILGADDKAGVTILLHLIENQIPGLYYFFIGEEVGCIGSGLAAKRTKFFKYYNRIISFDRRGTTSVITHQSGKRSCSDEFAQSLSRELNRFNLSYQKDSTGIYTDSAEFMGIIPECTNLSVGYYKEHTHFEHQDIDHLIQLCGAVVKIDWESLPTKRDASKVEWSNQDYSGWSNFGKPKNKNRYDYGHNRQPSYEKNWDKRSKKLYWDDDLDRQITKKGKNWQLDSPEPKKFKSFDDDSVKIRNDIKIRGDLNLKRYIFNDSLNKKELEIIKDQYLDMNDPEDRKFADYITDLL